MKRLLTILLPTLTQIGALSAQVTLRIDLNVANCSSHTSAISSIKRITSVTEKLVVLSRSDSLASKAILKRFGIGSDETIRITYEDGVVRAGSLIDGVYSRVRLFSGPEVLYDLNLDDLPSHIETLNSLFPTSPKYRELEFQTPLVYSSKTQYTANQENYWLLDRLLVTLVRISALPDSTRLHPETFQFDHDAYLSLLKLINREPIASSDSIDPADLLSLEHIQPSSEHGNSVDIVGSIRAQFEETDTSRRATSDFPSILFTIANGRISSCRAIAKSDSSEKPIYSNLGVSGFSTQGDLLLGQVVRWGSADVHPLFAYYDTSSSTISQHSYPNFAYPKVLWDNDFQYQFINGSFSKSAFGFAKFPLVVTTTDWKLHDISKPLEVSMDSTLAGVRSHYFCKRLYTDGNVTSLLCFAKGKLLVAKFTADGFMHIGNTQVDYSSFDRVSAVLVDHHRIWAISAKRDKLISISLE